MFRRIEDIILTNQVNLKEMRASEKCKLRSLRCSKLRARSLLAASLELVASLELAVTSSEQQAPELRACLLRARSLLQQAPELACCKLVARSLLTASSELALQQASEFETCCSKLRSSKLACCKLGAYYSKLWSYPELGKLRSSPELGKLRSSPELGACCMKEMQAPELSGARSLLHERNASSEEAPKLRSLRCNKLRVASSTAQRRRRRRCHRLLLLLLFLQHKEKVTQREMLTWVLRGSSCSRSKLQARSKFQVRSCSKPAPSSKLAPAQRLWSQELWRWSEGEGLVGGR